MEILWSSSALSTALIIIMVLTINGVKDIPEDDEWGLFETLIAIFFGWISVLYILISYRKYLFR